MNSEQFDSGPVMIIVFGSLAVTMSFLSFGLGYINLAKGVAGPDPEARKAAQVTEVDRSATERAYREVNAMQRELELLSAEIDRARKPAATGANSGDGLAGQIASLKGQSAELARRNAETLSLIADAEKQTAGLAASVRETEFKVTDARRRLRDAEHRIAQLRQAAQAGKDDFDATRLGGSMKNPQLVECVKDEVVLQPQGERITVKEIKASDNRFVNAVRRKEVFFLVRPSGFKSFDAALIAAENLSATVGTEPVDEDKAIRFRRSQ